MKKAFTLFSSHFGLFALVCLMLVLKQTGEPEQVNHIPGMMVFRMVKSVEDGVGFLMRSQGIFAYEPAGLCIELPEIGSRSATMCVVAISGAGKGASSGYHGSGTGSITSHSYQAIRPNNRNMRMRLCMVASSRGR